MPTISSPRHSSGWVSLSVLKIFSRRIYRGLPTWYEVRVNEKGYLGRRGGYDFVIAVNGQTLRRDYDELRPGGYFLYDSTRRLPDTFNRDDVIHLAIPLTEICNREIENPRMRQLLKNIIYVGALAALLDIDFSILTNSIKKQFAKKPKLADPNILALELGYAYADEHFNGLCKLKVKATDQLGDDIILDGNTATGLGALYGGATVIGWYPITPSTSVIEAFQKFAGLYRKDSEGKVKAAILQAEDELAALGIAMGASWNGARGFTATSGPGISLMNEFLGLAYFAEIPVVLADVQRAGPSTGMPTRSQQSDILLCAYASHGDTKHVLLFPSTPKECFEMTAEAFDIADRLQTPVILMSDLDLGMNDHICPPLTWDDNKTYDRGKILTSEDLEKLTERWGRYRDVDGDGIGYRTLPGTHPELGAYFTRGSSHDEYAVYSEDNQAYQQKMERLLRKWQTAATLVPSADITIIDDAAAIGLIFYGTSSQAAYEAHALLREEDIVTNCMQIKAFPFGSEVTDFIDKHEKVFVIEQNRDGQLCTLLLKECRFSPDRLIPLLHYDGLPITAGNILTEIHSYGQSKGGVR